MAKAGKKITTRAVEPTPGALEALIEIVECLELGIPITESAKNPFIVAARRFTSFEVPSLDDAFGRLLKKGEHLPDARRRSKLSTLIFEYVTERHAAGERDWKAMFEDAGEKFGVGATLAEKIYRAEKARRIQEQVEIFRHATE
jgi:hypothetical protein